MCWSWVLAPDGQEPSSTPKSALYEAALAALAALAPKTDFVWLMWACLEKMGLASSIKPSSLARLMAKLRRSRSIGSGPSFPRLGMTLARNVESSTVCLTEQAPHRMMA